ncbi:MAG TPA: asparagine synthase (glutamine-hydrolyzing) [Gemmatimonadaceae bacterium]
MCGIAGFWDDRQRGEAAATVVRRMTDAIAHRGPDDSGCDCEDGSPALGHRRLSILDISAAGHQPMSSSSRRFVISFNGEIYNFGELRTALEGKGHRWRGHSDTEVLLAGVETWGLAGALERAVGMFALALWDREARVLQLARDRFGEKPLYYGWAGEALVFGSELKALRAHPDWRAEVDRDALALFMRYGYIPAPHSIYRGVRKVPPGTILAFRGAGRDREPEATTYWSAHAMIEEGMRNPLRLDDAELVEACDARLTATVGDEMVSDVPLGAFLSGGIDSSLIVALMKAANRGPVRTFTIGFDVAGYDEATHAKAVAAHLGTEHTELYVTPQDTLDVIPRLPSLYDEPFADPSQIPTFLVAQLARRHVTVALSGDGGDELFCGYNRYFWGSRLWGKLRHMPPSFRRGIAGGLRAVPPARWDAVFDLLGRAAPSRRVDRAGDKLHKLADAIGVDSSHDMYRMLTSHWRNAGAITRHSSEPATVLERPAEWPKVTDFVEQMMYLDLVSYLPDDILVKVDRASMGVSLETRAPFLDHRVAEFAWRVPLHQKMRGGKGKWLLRQVLHKHVPQALVDRPKTGFAIPIDHWLRGELKEWAGDLLSADTLGAQGYFDPGAIARKWQEHQSGSRNWQHPLWNALMFQAWLAASGA